MPGPGRGHIKPPEHYEAEATKVGECLIHSSANVARRVYVKRHGALTRFQYVCHTCDQPQCITDSHHFIGSPTDNMQDALRKGRLDVSGKHLKRGENWGNKSNTGKPWPVERREKFNVKK